TSQEPKYWLIVLTGTTWSEFLQAGATTYGLSDRYEATANRVTPGDYLVCYVAGISRFIGLLQVTSKAFRDTSEIWQFDVYPIRLKVNVIVQLVPETAIPATELRSELSVFRNLKTPSSWAMRFRNSIKEWNKADASAVIKALNNAKQSPTHRPVVRAKLA